MPGSNWLIIELTEQAENASYQELTSALESFFDNTEYFIPIHHEQMGSYITSNVLFPGYAFIKDSLQVRSKLSSLKESRYFIGVLKQNNKIQTIDSYTIGSLRRKLKKSIRKKFEAGSRVKVLDGIFKNMSGEIISIEEDNKIANIRIRCMSREIIAPIPTSCIDTDCCDDDYLF